MANNSCCEIINISIPHPASKVLSDGGGKVLAASAKLEGFKSVMRSKTRMVWGNSIGLGSFRERTSISPQVCSLIEQTNTEILRFSLVRMKAAYMSVSETDIRETLSRNLTTSAPISDSPFPSVKNSSLPPF